MTTTAIPSLDVNDFKSNIQDFDAMANGTGTYTDRFGDERLTLDEFMRRNSYEVPVAFASGISVSRSTQTVTYNGDTYHAAPSAVPFTTTGTFNSAQWLMLRQNLEPQGIVLADKVITGFDATSLRDGAWVHFAGRDTVGDGGGGMFRYSASSAQPADDATVFSPAVGSGKLFREGWTVLGFNGAIKLAWAGAYGATTGSEHVAIQRAIDVAYSLKTAISAAPKTYRVGTTLDMPPGLRVTGAGAARQQGSCFMAVGGVSIFTARSGFGSESCAFENLVFDSDSPGSGSAFAASTTSYISQGVFNECVFKSNLRYAFNAPVILCSFDSCDFGSYPGSAQLFTSFNCVGTIGSFEPNANSFSHCVFRKSSAPYQINIDTAGVQWNFFSCDFEQNSCSQTIIRNNGAGAISFYGGYVEANSTPYFVRSYGDLSVAFCQVVRLHNVQVNNPVTTAILKREIAYPMFDIQGCYGQLNCNVTQDESGNFNTIESLEASFGNYFVAGTGSFGSIATVNTSGFNAGKFGAKLLSTQALKFPSTQVASSDPNTMDDYEESSPSLSDASGAGLSVAGSYVKVTKIGNTVTINGALVLPATANTSPVNIAGIPYVESSYAPMSTVSNSGLDVSVVLLSGNLKIFAPGSFTEKTYAQMSGSTVYFSGSYIV